MVHWTAGTGAPSTPAQAAPTTPATPALLAPVSPAAAGAPCAYSFGQGGHTWLTPLYTGIPTNNINLYLHAAGSQAIPSPYTVTIYNPIYSQVTSVWNYQVRFSWGLIDKKPAGIVTCNAWLSWCGHSQGPKIMMQQQCSFPGSKEIFCYTESCARISNAVLSMCTAVQANLGAVQGTVTGTVTSGTLAAYANNFWNPGLLHLPVSLRQPHASCLLPGLQYAYLAIVWTRPALLIRAYRMLISKVGIHP